MREAADQKMLVEQQSEAGRCELIPRLPEMRNDTTFIFRARSAFSYACDRNIGSGPDLHEPEMCTISGMGTELQTSPSLFKTLPRSHGGAMTMSWDGPETRASAIDPPPTAKTHPAGPASGTVQQPMKKWLPCLRESLRKTMLEHEKIFREQVQELHRLYKTQKLLMSQPEVRERKKLHPVEPTAPAAAAHPCSVLCSSDGGGVPSTSNGHHRSFQQNNEHNPDFVRRAKTTLGSQELSIRSKQIISPRPSCSDDEECDLELTLGIGGAASKKRTGPPSHSDTPVSSVNSAGHRAETAPARSDPGGTSC